jgi:hypothetical protein
MERLTRNAPTVLMVVALAASAVLTLALTAHLTFFGDTWEFLMNRHDFTAEAVLKPHNEHIVVFPVLIEQSLLRLFGMTNATPEFAVLTVGLLATASLVFVYVKRRVGPWLGLFAAVLVLFLGPAWEVLLWPFEIGFVGSTLFGLAMLLTLERSDRRGDLAACVFLALSLGFSSLGIAFVVAAAVSVLQGPRATWRSRAYLVVIPLLLYAAWYVGWGHEAETHMSLRNLLASPRFVAESIAVAVGAVFGLGTSPFGGSVDPVWGRSILIALVLLLAYRQTKKPGFFPGLWPVVAAAATSWVLTALNAMPGRDPTTSRYQYAGVIFVLLLLANLLRDARLEKRAIVAVGAITVLAVGPNLVVLKDGQKWFTQQTVLTRSDTAAIEIAHRTVNPEFSLTPEVAGTPTLVDVSAAKYLSAVDEYGSPAYSPAELAFAPEEGRRQADIVLSKALPISSATRSGGTGRPGAGARCVTLPGDGASTQREVPLRPGLTTIELAAGPPAQLALRRFAENEFPVALEGGYGGTVTALRIPADSSPRPWFLHVEAQQQARICQRA